MKAWDRRNVGTITAIDDAAGSIEVTFVAADGRIAARRMGWGDVTIVLPRHPLPRGCPTAGSCETKGLSALSRTGEHLSQD